MTGLLKGAMRGSASRLWVTRSRVRVRLPTQCLQAVYLPFTGREHAAVHTVSGNRLSTQWLGRARQGTTAHGFPRSGPTEGEERVNKTLPGDELGSLVPRLNNITRQGQGAAAVHIRRRERGLTIHAQFAATG